MKTIQFSTRTLFFVSITVVLLSACGSNNNPPTPIPSPEEKPTQSAPVDGTSQSQDSTVVLPKQ